MAEPPSPRYDIARAAHEVEEHIEELGDPEASPGNPTSTLAVGATPERVEGARRTGTSREIVELAWPVMRSMTLASVVGLRPGQVNPATTAGAGGYGRADLTSRAR